MLSLALAACSEDCIQPPCPSPTAILLTLTAASGTSFNAVVTVTGGSSEMVPCAGGPTGATCVVSGYAGTYNLAVAAPGFHNVLRTVVVTGEAPGGCGCPLIDTQHISIVLVSTT